MQEHIISPANAGQSEPASQLYVLDKGWSDLYAGLKTLHRWMMKSLITCMSPLTNASATPDEMGWAVLLYWIYAIVCCAVGVICALFFLGVMLLCALFASLLLSIGAGGALLMIAAFHLPLEAYRRRWSMAYACPTPYCYRQMPLPVFLCAQCQAHHAHLRPNIYGIWRHRCRCGTMLRTLDRFGRHSLARLCPRCGNGLDHEIGQGTNIHLPLVGGPSAGKTHYMTAILDEVSSSDRWVQQSTLTFLAYDRQKHFFQANVQRLRQGQRLAATADIAPAAYTLRMDVPGIPVPKILYMYDAAGETFTLDERTNLQTYYTYIHGLIFLIDPCAISAFRLRYEQEIEALKHLLSPSSSDITHVYDRMMRQLEKKRGIRTHRRYPFPIAVVVTKTDALGLEQVIGADAARELLGKDPHYTSEEDAIDSLVRQFLENYRLGNLVRNLDAHFSHVRYFSCSSLGRLPVPGMTERFQPLRTLEPFLWLLTQIGALNPKAGRRSLDL